MVVVAGPAGTAAALRAAELGASVAVLEADGTGGTCVNHGCVPTRVLAKTARLVREVGTAARYGVGSTAAETNWAATVERVRFPRRVAIIGSGHTGSQLTTIFSSVGAHVASRASSGKPTG